MSVAIRRIGVVIPAHDEELVVARCLESIGRAARAVSLPVTVMVVLDDCRDRTERVCRSFPVDVMAVTARSVGVARHAGASALLSGVPDTDAIWLANTDADSVVPTVWLRDQIDLAMAGADAVVGTVGLSDEESALGRDFKVSYARRVRRGWDHRHVHGANLGVRGSAYLGVGGFPPLAVHEDRLLLRRLDASGATVVRSTRVRVQTSARLRGRCEGGFATALTQLASAS
jgi:cellulose synthase/poly-beta-1,6-N-acetylglucosamine synthase-like glycosyltransferase